MGLSENLNGIRQRIEAACQRASRNSAEIQILGVTKGQPPDAIKEAMELGLVLFGENKVQEARTKKSLCPGRARWHMIGHLQTNKCKDAVQLFEMVQSVDSFKVAEELNKWCEKFSKRLPVLLEVNVAGESTKFGYSPPLLLSDLPQLNGLNRLEIHGLMTIAPWSPHPERSRPFFRKLKEIRQDCEQILGVPLPQLSMGMSGDFEVAVEEGATLLRIGTALFGPRQSWKPHREADEF